MRIKNYRYPKSSFLSIEKDLGIIIDLFLKNERLKKLLYYTTDDCLLKEALTDDETIELVKKGYIRIVPKLEINAEVMNYIVIQFTDFVENENNPQFRDNIIIIDIICHHDQWQLKDFQLRPYKIAAEIDSMITEANLTNMGKIYFNGARQVSVSDEFACVQLSYVVIHGGEDKVNAPNPDDWEDIKDNFNNIFNKEDEIILL